MASKNFTGYLRDPLGEYAEFDKWTFTHITATGETVPGCTSVLNIGDNGFYDINIEYGMVNIRTKDAINKNTVNQGTYVINSETLVSTLPALLNAEVPVSDPIILQMEAILADAEAAADRAEAAAGVFEVDTTEYLINTGLPENPSVGDVVQSFGYSQKGDNGGCKWFFSGVTGQLPSQSPGDFEQPILTDPSGNQWKVLFARSFDIRKLGASPSKPDNIGVLVAGAIIAKDTDNTLYVADDLQASDNQIALADVTFIGKGSLEGVYRKNVFEEPASTIKPSFFQLPDTQTSRMSKSNPRVVLVGDSISTYAANSRNRNYMLAGALEREITRQFGECEFFDRAIGGATYTNLDGLPSRFDLEWYVDTLKPWLDYVEELKPDSVVISFGMNDSSSVNYGNIKSIAQKIEAWDKVPSIIFCTNLTPSLSGNRNGDYATESEQEGRDYAAGITRTFAIYHNYGLLDFNRQNNFVRDGLDVFGGIIGQSETVSPLNDAASGSKRCYNYRAEISIDESKLLDSSGVYVDITLDDILKSKVRVRNFGGNLRFSFNVGTSASTIDNYSIVDTGEAVGNTSRSLCIEVSGGTFTAYRNDYNLGESSDPIITAKIMRPGGLITPLISSNNDGKLGNVRFDYGNGFVGYPEVNDRVLWGDADSALSIREWDGSGWNHPSSHVFSYVYDPILSNVKFKGTGQFFTAGLSDMFYTDAAIVADATGPAGGGKFYSLPLSDSIDKSAAFTCQHSRSVTAFELHYIGDTSGGTDASLQIIISSTDSSGQRVTKNLIVGTAELNNTSSDLNIYRKDIPAGQLPLNISEGDEISLFRLATNVDDNYGELKFIGITIY